MRVIDSLGSVKYSILGIAGSGVIQSGHLADNSVTSGSIASGQVSRFKLASGAANSGHIASGAVTGHAGGGAFNIASGSIAATTNGNRAIGSGAILSGHIAIGAIGTYHFGRNNLDESVASGNLLDPTAHILKTFVTNTQYVGPMLGALGYDAGAGYITEEIISGGRAVCISLSGHLRIAMAASAPNVNTNRMPAIGVVMDNILSGLQADVYSHGQFAFTSGLANSTLSGYFGYSGYLGRTLVVGPSGHIHTLAGSGNVPFDNLNIRQFQRIGVAVNSGGFIANVDPFYWSGQLGAGGSDVYTNVGL